MSRKPSSSSSSSLSSTSSSYSSLSSSSESDDYYDSEICKRRGLNFICRQSWKAPKPKWGLGPPLLTPAKKVFCVYTYRSSCYTLAGCKNEMHMLVNRDMKQLKYPDLQYNFVIGNNLRVYEGRGWWTRPCLPKGFELENKHSVYIGFTGIYFDGRISRELLDMRDMLVLYGIENNFIAPDYKLFSSLREVKR